MRARASTDVIARWWRCWPDANVGVVTGSVSGLAVIDVDPRNGGPATLLSLEEEHGVLPMTAEVRTGGGGTHLWFGIAGDVPSGVLGAGVDLKAQGGMVVAPPSVHSTGRRYVWRPGGDPDALSLAELPEWVIAGVTDRPDGAGPAASIEPPPRTEAERREFSEAWRGAGIELDEGDNYYLCPFHDDHHPSLHIDSEGCRWYCFGCRNGGGIARLLEMTGAPHRSRPRGRLKSSRGRGLPITLAGTHRVEVVGESHHQDALLDLAGGRRRFGGVELEAVAELVPDPSNPHDRNAVEVRIEGAVVGHIGRGDLEWLGPIVEDSGDLHGLATCRAVIRGGWDRGAGEVGRFGVLLFLPETADR